MENVFLLDTSLGEHFKGGQPATILPHEFATIRPLEPRRRVDEVFRKGVPLKMPYDLAMFFIKKYPDRFCFVNAMGEPVKIGDDLDEMLYGDIKDILCKINRELKAEDKKPYPITGGRPVLVKYIREYRALKAEEERIAQEIADEEERQRKLLAGETDETDETEKDAEPDPEAELTETEV